MSLKDKISSPLEAGPSILDAHHLPPHLSPALEYASGRLARRAMHITIVVVRRDFQLPAVVPPLGSPGVSPPQTPSSPGLMLKTASSVASLRQLVRAASFSRKSSRAGDRSTSVSPTSMGSSPESPRGGMRWPVSPVSPMSPTPRTPRTPMTPGTPSTISSSGTNTSRFLDQSAHGMRFIHAAEPSAREDKVLHQTLSKAGRKFHLGPESLPPVEQASACGLPQSLIHASLTQNEVLFSAEGLTILALDGLYSLKSALSAYHKTKSPMRLEDAVDELRRLVLASGGRKVTKSDLLRSYDWLGISHSAISDLDRMYRRAYGGPEQIGGIAGMTASRARQVHTYRPGTHKDTDDDADTLIGKASESSINAASIPPAEWDKPPSPKLPQLPKIQTTFAPLPMAAVGSSFSCRTASMVTTTTTRPNDGRITMMQPWGPDSSIDNIMTAGALSPERASARLGPITPNKYDDISPITRGEWGFLMVDDAFRGVRTAAVETC